VYLKRKPGDIRQCCFFCFLCSFYCRIVEWVSFLKLPNYGRWGGRPPLCWLCSSVRISVKWRFTLKTARKSLYNPMDKRSSRHRHILFREVKKRSLLPGAQLQHGAALETPVPHLAILLPCHIPDVKSKNILDLYGVVVHENSPVVQMPAVISSVDDNVNRCHPAIPIP
jgi:hypothetical protein